MNQKIGSGYGEIEELKQKISNMRTNRIQSNWKLDGKFRRDEMSSSQMVLTGIQSGQSVHAFRTFTKHCIRFPYVACISFTSFNAHSRRIEHDISSFLGSAPCSPRVSSPWALGMVQLLGDSSWRRVVQWPEKSLFHFWKIQRA